MKELVEYMAKSLVDNPDKVTVNEVIEGENLIVKLKVAPEDMGRIIGKQGKVANALRTVLKALAMKKHKRVTLEII